MKKKKTFVFKYGGNAMIDNKLSQEILQNICEIKSRGHKVVIVHGGGPFIQELLDKVEIPSEFINGQRKTSAEALDYIEMVLRGKVNGKLVNMINSLGHLAVGLSGKDANTIIAKKRTENLESPSTHTEVVDLGFVGDIQHVDTSLINLLLKNDYIPVITCIATDENNQDLNINADIFAGNIAAAMNANELIFLTDVSGLYRDITDENSLIDTIAVQEIQSMVSQGLIKSGMIPKTEAAITAVLNGAQRARIINGTKPDTIFKLINKQSIGTVITP